jgi:hypothetical protein
LVKLFNTLWAGGREMVIDKVHEAMAKQLIRNNCKEAIRVFLNLLVVTKEISEEDRDRYILFIDAVIAYKIDGESSKILEIIHKLTDQSSLPTVNANCM